MSKSFVGRQAIYNSGLEVHAYELLYRSHAEAGTAEFVNGEVATARVLSSAFLEIGAQRLVGDVLCFINLTAAFLLEEIALPLPADRVVAEILEDVEPTPQIIKGVERLKESGVSIALDDYVHRPENEPLLHLSDYVKVDLLAQNRGETVKLVEMLQGYDVKLLAEKVETDEELQFCRDLGFEYFQGFFLTRPEVVEGKTLFTNRLGLLQMLTAVLDPNVDMDVLVDMINKDAALAYKLLLYANSTMYAPAQPITSIGQVLVMLGLGTVRKVISLLVLLDLDDKPGDLLSHSLVRAKMCETMAEQCHVEEPASYYTAGLFSILDALLGTTMESVLTQIHLSADIEEALLNGTGDHGSALKCVQAFEVGDWDRATYGGLGPVELTDAYAKAVTYSNEIWAGIPRGRRAA